MDIGQLGKQIRDRRRSLGIDQKTVAELASTSVHSLSNIETGKANPAFSLVTRVLDVLGLELAVRPRELNLG